MSTNRRSTMSAQRPINSSGIRMQLSRNQSGIFQSSSVSGTKYAEPYQATK
ncbi:hypothetical protein D3C85_1535140 [compost metagenome]